MDFEALCAELSPKKRFIFCIHNPHNWFIKDYLKELEKTIEFYSKMYEIIIMLSDFEVEIS